MSDDIFRCLCGLLKIDIKVQRRCRILRADASLILSIQCTSVAVLIPCSCPLPRHQVCGLKWSPDHQHLASGGNDNKLFVWSSRAEHPVHTYSEHLAAVKAIAWSPHQHGLLASGGGTADRRIRFVSLLLLFWGFLLLFWFYLSTPACLDLYLASNNI